MELLVTREIVAEYARAGSGPNVSRLFARKGVDAAEFTAVVAAIARKGRLVEPTGEAPPCRDEDDRKFLHAALAGDADYLITYDRDLLDIGSIGRAAILTPPEAMERLRADGVRL